MFDKGTINRWVSSTFPPPRNTIYHSFHEIRRISSLVNKKLDYANLHPKENLSVKLSNDFARYAMCGFFAWDFSDVT